MKEYNATILVDSQDKHLDIGRGLECIFTNNAEAQQNEVRDYEGPCGPHDPDSRAQIFLDVPNGTLKYIKTHGESEIAADYTVFLEVDYFRISRVTFVENTILILLYPNPIGWKEVDISLAT